METDALKSFIGALSGEHARLERVVSELFSENARLRAELGSEAPRPFVTALAAGLTVQLQPPSVCSEDSPRAGDEEDGGRRPSAKESGSEDNTDLASEEAPSTALPRSDGTGGRRRLSRTAIGSDCSEEPHRRQSRIISRTNLGSESSRGPWRLSESSSPTAPRSADSGEVPREHPEWALEDGDDADVMEPAFAVQRVASTTKAEAMYDSRKAKSGGRLVSESGLCKNLVLHPGCKTRSMWDLCSLIIICYDILFIPFDLGGFSIPEARQILFVFDQFSAIFWAADIVMSFITGYHTGGLVEMRIENIARRYVRGWFLFDLCVAITDWVFIFMGGATIARIGKSKRFLRLIRTLRLVRSVKMTVKMSEMLAGLRSERLRILSNTVVLGLSVLTLNHYFACGWYYVGTSSDPDSNWVLKNVWDEGTGMRYATALHWSFTQFTPAGMEIHPNNLAERVYTVVTVFFAMITFSSFMGSITANMTALRKLTSEPAEQQKILFKYFVENGVSAELGTRIWGYLKTRHFAHQKQLLRKDIPVLKVLPQSLSSDLNNELYVPILKTCPVFYFYGVVHYYGLCGICDSNVTEEQVAHGERVFHSGRVAGSMHFVIAGELNYEHKDPTKSTTLVAQEWAAEPAMWMKWVYCGTLEAQMPCRLASISAAKFRTYVVESPRALHYIRRYVAGFRAWLVECAADEVGTWKTDVWLQGSELQQIAARAMAEEDLPEAAVHPHRGPSWLRQASGVAQA